MRVFRLNGSHFCRKDPYAIPVTSRNNMMKGDEEREREKVNHYIAHELLHTLYCINSFSFIRV